MESMNIDHLSREEFEVECGIRGIDPSSVDANRQLTIRLNDEAIHSSNIPTQPHKYRSLNSEMITLTNLFTELEALAEEGSREADQETMTIAMSRFIHLKFRLIRMGHLASSIPAIGRLLSDTTAKLVLLNCALADTSFGTRAEHLPDEFLPSPSEEASQINFAQGANPDENRRPGRTSTSTVKNPTSVVQLDADPAIVTAHQIIPVQPQTAIGGLTSTTDHASGERQSDIWQRNAAVLAQLFQGGMSHPAPTAAQTRPSSLGLGQNPLTKTVGSSRPLCTVTQSEVPAVSGYSLFPSVGARPLYAPDLFGPNPFGLPDYRSSMPFDVPTSLPHVDPRSVPNAGNRTVRRTPGGPPPPSDIPDPYMSGNGRNQNNSGWSYRGDPSSMICRWKISFNGGKNGLTVEDFVFRCESMADGCRLPLSDLYDNLYLMLADRAADWYWQFKRSQPLADWTTLRNRFCHFFRSQDGDYDIRRTIESRKQGQRESVADFCLEVTTLVNRMSNPMPEQEVIEVLRRNMAPYLQRMTFRHNSRTVDDLIDLCRDAENLVYRLPSSAHFPSSRSIVGEISDAQGVSPFANALPSEPVAPMMVPVHVEVVEALDPSLRICFNCKDVGHGYVDCPIPVRGIFCYGCGADNVLKPNCMICKFRKENRMRNVTGSAAAHSGPKSSQKQY